MGKNLRPEGTTPSQDLLRQKNKKQFQLPVHGIALGISQAFLSREIVEFKGR